MEVAGEGLLEWSGGAEGGFGESSSGEHFQMEGRRKGTPPSAPPHNKRQFSGFPCCGGPASQLRSWPKVAWRARGRAAACARWCCMAGLQEAIGLAASGSLRCAHGWWPAGTGEGVGDADGMQWPGARAVLTCYMVQMKVVSARKGRSARAELVAIPARACALRREYVH